MSEPDIYVQIRQNEKRATKKPQIDFQIPDTHDLEQLIEALHTLSDQTRGVPYYHRTRTTGRKQINKVRSSLIEKIQKSLKSIDHDKADAIKQKLFDELGILLP